MIAHLFNAPVGDNEAAVGVGTVGSSEAIMLAGLAFKRKWQQKRKAEGKPFDKPNIVTGANVQVISLHSYSFLIRTNFSKSVFLETPKFAPTDVVIFCTTQIVLSHIEVLCGSKSYHINFLH